ncbi:MAG: hypothetical protein HND56_03740 [Pseudomonadota bacterium]|nr:hypothetical protein [Pseudomonadota bacterium]QKK04854.1 MAG: hypothetical protein HND56_03740 [Pseudomonadota bacterium]
MRRFFNICSLFVLIAITPQYAHALDDKDLNGERNGYAVYQSCKNVIETHMSDDEFAKTVCYASIQSYIATVLNMVWYIPPKNEEGKKISKVIGDLYRRICTVTDQRDDFRDMAEDYVAWLDEHNTRNRGKASYVAFPNALSRMYNCPSRTSDETADHYRFDQGCCSKERKFILDHYVDLSKYRPLTDIKEGEEYYWPNIGIVNADLNGDGKLDTLSYISEPCDVCDKLPLYFEEPFSGKAEQILIFLKNDHGDYTKIDGPPLMRAQIRVYKNKTNNMKDLGLETKPNEWCIWKWDGKKYQQDSCSPIEKKKAQTAPVLSNKDEN